MAYIHLISVPAISSAVTTPFSQTLVASLDDAYDIKHALLNGSLPFHEHPDNDEAFYLLFGELFIQVLPVGEKTEKDAADVKMKTGDIFVVPRGMVHRPVGKQAHVLIMEKKGVPGGNGQIAKEIAK